MAPIRLNAVAFVSPLNHPILIRTFSKEPEIKYHYIAHTSLDVIEERLTAGGKNVECYLGLLYAIDDVAVYGYITPLKVKIVLALGLSSDSTVVRDAEITLIFKALHMAYYAAISNPFLKLDAPTDTTGDHSLFHLVGSAKYSAFRRRVDEIAVGSGTPIT